MLEVIAMPPPMFLLAGGLQLAALAYVAWRRRGSARDAEQDVFRAFGTDAKSALRRYALPPDSPDLHPIEPAFASSRRCSARPPPEPERRLTCPRNPGPAEAGK